jgi:hypothetical protein
MGRKQAGYGLRCGVNAPGLFTYSNGCPEMVEVIFVYIFRKIFDCADTSIARVEAPRVGKLRWL